MTSNGSADAERARIESVDPDDAIWWLWGKAQPDPKDTTGPRWHPLICHMIDVMSVGDAMLDRLSEAARAVLVEPLGGPTHARPWLRFLIAMHDAGKPTPGFQGKWDGNRDELARRNLPTCDRECHVHGISGTMLLTELLCDASLLGPCALPEDTAQGLARAVASHHGQFAKDPDVEECRDDWSRLNQGDWRQARRRLARLILKVAAQGQELEPLPERLECNPAFVLALTGLTAVADWLGSNADVFRYEPLPVDITEYQRVAARRATRALDAVRWQAPHPRKPRTFVELFPDLAPRSLQLATEAVVSSVNAPSLVIIESTMGDGKTEAALLIAEALGPRLGQAGLYVGLPTQATANQMLGRVQAFLERNEPVHANLQLVHGDAGLSKRFDELKLRGIHGDADANVTAQTWFCRSKRSLLASHAVGTVDQGLLGVLQTRHGFVRLFGLAGKTVVLDEVHAYDTYTSEILDRLVAWLAALRATVVVLSATLPKTRRAKLIQAYGVHAPAEEAPYPRITVACPGSPAISVATKPSRPSQDVRIERLPDDLDVIAARIAEATAEGGCCAWICNTIQRAQDAYLALKALRNNGKLQADTRLDLLHARFLRKDRQLRERHAEELYGPPKAAKRPFRGVLVGTQVLEQSLDLDFDFMVTDLAPIDLVLQRTGRLHRHDRPRPAAHRTPRLGLVEPALEDGCPTFDSVARVYDRDVMFRTWWELRNVESFRIPEELETWVERVYGDLGSEPSDPDLRAAFERAVHEASEERRGQWNQAQSKLLFSPVNGTREDRFGSLYKDLVDDENGEVSPDLRAATRLAEPSTDVVCLFPSSGGLSLDREGTAVVDLERPASVELARTLVEHSVKVENRRLRRYKDCLLEPKPWREQAMLRHRKVLVLGGEAERQGVSLDPELGLVFRWGGP